MYKIIVDYVTGDSFNSYIIKKDIGMIWKDKSAAEMNLQRIIEHDNWYKGKLKRPKWLHKSVSKESIVLKTDSGKDCKIFAFWHGFFDYLRCPEIKQVGGVEEK